MIQFFEFETILLQRQMLIETLQPHQIAGRVHRNRFQRRKVFVQLECRWYVTSDFSLHKNTKVAFEENLNIRQFLIMHFQIEPPLDGDVLLDQEILADATVLGIRLCNQRLKPIFQYCAFEPHVALRENANPKPTPDG